MKDQTLAIHAGFKSDPATNSVTVPIYQTVAYEFDNAQHGADLFNLAVPGRRDAGHDPPVRWHRGYRGHHC